MRSLHLLFCSLLAVLLVCSPVRADEIDGAALSTVPTTGPGVEETFETLAAKMGAKPSYIRLLTDNQESWFARWKMLEDAKTSIDCTYYIIEGDVFGQSFLGMLLRKAKAGVKVRLMLDARGTGAGTFHLIGQTIFEKLASAPNVEIKVYNPFEKAVKGLDADLRACMASNHEKLIIVDGEWLLTGGRNISRHYFVDVQDMPDAYRDTDILMRGGDVPAQAQRAFEEEFNKTINVAVAPDAGYRGGEIDLDLGRRMMQQFLLGMALPAPTKGTRAEQVADLSMELKELPHMRGYSTYVPFRGERAYPSLLLDKHSLRQNRRNDITANLEKLLDSARTEIYIQNPYVILTERARACLHRCCKRGVKIILNTNSPESSDSVMTQSIFVRDWKQILHDYPTMRIFAVKNERKLHSKVFVIDRKVAVVGTYNMDHISEEINSENVVAVRSGPFATQNCCRIDEDMKNAVEYKIRVEADGTIVEVTGPSSHCDPAKVDWIQRLGSFSFLRPLM